MMNLKSIPWGRLVSCSKTGMDFDLLPREPQQQQQLDHHNGISFLGLTTPIHASHKFNEFVLGRSPKADVILSKPNLPPSASTASNTSAKHATALHDWAHAMISNRHCRIFCMLTNVTANHTSTNLATTTTTLPPTPPNIGMHVFLEDSSGNGTYVNQNIPLGRGQSRLLHTGDQICLVNPQHLRKKVRSETALQHLLQHYSFVFINLYQQQQQQQQVPPLLMPLSQQQQQQQQHGSNQHNTTTATPAAKAPVGITLSSALRQRQGGIVNIRAMKLPSLQNHQQSNNHVMVSSYSPQEPFPRPQNLPQLTSTSLRRRIEQEYDMRDILGSGTCGQVRRAIHRLTGREVAVKMIPMGRTARRPPSTAALLRAPPQQQQRDMETTLLAEANILRALDHPYIVQLYDVFMDPGDDAMYLVMELLQGGDLFDRIVQKGRYTETASRQVLRRLLNALHYLHEERNIVHRDLKPENILLVHTDNDIAIKLTDFGLAKSITDDGLKTFCGTPAYFAPEVLKRRHTVTGRGRYGKKADMWSVGVILYVLLSGIPPFEAIIGDDEEEPLGVMATTMDHDDDEQLGNRSLTFPAPYWNDVSEQAKDLVRRLLIDDPRQRLSVHEACDHVWLSASGDGDTHAHPLQDPAVAPVPTSSSSRQTKRVSSPRPTTTTLSTPPFLSANNNNVFSTFQLDSSAIVPPAVVSKSTPLSSVHRHTATDDKLPLKAEWTDHAFSSVTLLKAVECDLGNATSASHQSAEQPPIDGECLMPTLKGNDNARPSVEEHLPELEIAESKLSPETPPSVTTTLLQTQHQDGILANEISGQKQSPVKEKAAVTSPCSCLSEMRHHDALVSSALENGTPSVNNSSHVVVASSSCSSPSRQPLSPILVQQRVEQQSIIYSSGVNDGSTQSKRKGDAKKMVIIGSRSRSQHSASVEPAAPTNMPSTILSPSQGIKRKFVAAELSDDEVCSQFSDELESVSNLANVGNQADSPNQPKKTIEKTHTTAKPRQRQQVRDDTRGVGNKRHDKRDSLTDKQSKPTQTKLSTWIKKM
jgi:phosphorylase kinase gamma subunit/serine/threonine-protein kinase Chk2/calcium/calmodulin-dependent protein kinase I